LSGGRLDPACVPVSKVQQFDLKEGIEGHLFGILSEDASWEGFYKQKQKGGTDA